jgi:hypothetical protein
MEVRYSSTTLARVVRPPATDNAGPRLGAAVGTREAGAVARHPGRHGAWWQRNRYYYLVGPGTIG